MAGFTSVRDVGSQPFFAVDLRRAIDSGYIPGPRIVASGPAISITGGHGDMNGFAPGIENMMYPSENDYAIADGPEAVRHVVREQISTASTSSRSSPRAASSRRATSPAPSR